MEKITYNGTDIFNPIDGKLDKVIDYFALFYGESSRAEITKKLKDDTTYIFLPKNGDDGYDVFAGVRDYFDDIKEAAYRRLDGEFGVDLKIWRYGDQFYAGEVMRLAQELLNHSHLSTAQNAVVKQFAKAYKIKLKRKLFEYDIYTHKTTLMLAEQMERYYKVYESKYQDLLCHLEQEKDTIINKITNQMPNIRLLESKMEEDIAQRTLESFEKLLTSRNISLDTPNLHKYFEIYLKLIKQERLYGFGTDEQKKEYVKLFKFLGIDYGDKYADYYLNDGYIESIVIDKDLLAFIRNQYRELYRKKADDNFFYLYALERVKSLDFKYRKDLQDICASLHNFIYLKPKTSAFVYSYLDGENNLKHICVLGDYFSLSKNTVVHEANHILETILMSEDAEAYYLKTGFDVSVHAKSDRARVNLSNFVRGEHRAYESINEIFNEYIASKIACKMENDGFEVGGNTTQRAYYEYGYTVFYKFLEENLDTIIKCRHSKDQYALANYISPKDLEEISQVAEDVLYGSKVNSEGFDIKKAIKEIEEKLKLKSITEIECANIIREKKLTNIGSFSNKWSKNALSLFDYARRVDEIACDFKRASLTSQEDKYSRLKQVASDERER